MEFREELGLKWDKSSKNITLVSSSDGHNWESASELATCKAAGNWNISERESLRDGYWVGSLKTIAAYLQINTGKHCEKSLFKVRCFDQFEGENISTTGGTGSIKITGKLPSLAFTPF